MEPVLINGFLYWVDYERRRIYNHNKESYTTLSYLTPDEFSQMQNCIMLEADKQRVQDYIKKYPPNNTKFN